MAWVLLLFALGPEPPYLTDHVDVIETSHYYDQDAKHIFSQHLFWRWNKHDCRYEIQAWRLIKHARNYPVGNKLEWFDDNDRVIRKVAATSERERWLQYDPEVADRELLSKEQRLELTPVPCRKAARQLLEGG